MYFDYTCLRLISQPNAGIAAMLEVDEVRVEPAEGCGPGWIPEPQYRPAGLVKRPRVGQIPHDPPGLFPDL